jgi:mRNA-degrading endonuclease RelE of RelBE toxin-antitoxin system
MIDMVIKETSVFTRQVRRLLDRESYRLLQLRLVAEPDAGELIRGTGGLRKIRWEAAGRGRRGGVRVIYYWAQRLDVILLLLIYSKSQQDDLTPEQKVVLKRLIQEEYP